MVLRTKIVLNGEVFRFDLDTEELDRNYDDENYAYWIIEDKYGRMHEVNVWKDEDGSYTNRGKDYVFSDYGAFEDAGDADLELDLTFTFLDQENENLIH